MPTQLKIDLDGDRAIANYAARREFAVECLRLKIMKEKMFRTRHGAHVYMTVRGELNDYQMICLQLILGSDYKRESFNLLRVSSGKFKNREWNVLFKVKYRVVRGLKTFRVVEVSRER